ncbi:MAG: GDP-mannose 4,6-dehydratase [Candidatus Wildermuthbacteria bacterium]|nr:GDP-mannose 4,6-dehydratase [Candidatus Wildermuthbacteria bacterium]
METKKKAVVTGITGQDGSFLAELLLSKGYEVHGFVRRASTFNRWRIDHLHTGSATSPSFFLHYAELTDDGSIFRLMHKIQPDEVYHLGAQSHVRISFDIPEFTVNTDAIGTIRVLEAIRDLEKPVKFYMACSSEMFGNMPSPQNEETQFEPRSPYAISKVFSYHSTRMYREGYKMFASNGILFNHESERRGENFVTRKITLGVAKIKAGLEKKLFLGNLEAKRDWGYAPEYVEAMWRMLQHSEADDFVIATGETHSVKEFLDVAFAYAGLGDWKPYVEIDPRFYRPVEVNLLQGDSSKAKRILGWDPKVKFNDLAKIMVDLDMQAYEIKAPGEGLKILREQFPYHRSEVHGV